jgi:hypothetical protein
MIMGILGVGIKLFDLTPYIPLSQERGGLNLLFIKPLPLGGGDGERPIKGHRRTGSNLTDISKISNVHY